MKKLTNKKGFTLMEMIIVVAIVAILAVITIPTLTGNTKKAAKAADEANFRSAKAVYQVKVMEDENFGKGNTPLYFNTSTGDFGTAEDKCGKCDAHKNQQIQLVSGTLSWTGTNQKCTPETAGNN